jgi:hypothetical protein
LRFCDADIQRGMGVISIRDLKTGTTYYKAVICPADSYGINGADPAGGVFKKYGRAVTPCTACPTNMKTAQYATPEANAENQITGYLGIQASTNGLQTETKTSGISTGGYYSVDACATQVRALWQLLLYKTLAVLTISLYQQQPLLPATVVCCYSSTSALLHTNQHMFASASATCFPRAHLQDGYGYYAGSSQICPAGTFNGKGNKNPCTQ